MPLHRRLRPSSAIALALPAFLAALALSTEAAAAPNVKRKGGQAELTFGGSLCIPGAADCSSSTTVVGKTGPSIGGGFMIGYRPIKQFLIGAAYNVGFFNPDYRLDSAADIDRYKLAYQHSLFVVLRGILPIWRLDLGVEVGPGWSRQVFQVNDVDYDLPTIGVATVDKEYSQGFALKTAPVVDIYITKHVFLGVKLDLIWNFHGEICYRYNGGDQRFCTSEGDLGKASVHQMIIGAHIGGTF
ncbi:MAG: hypothetical protein R3A51_19430 [Nannocystaceae bacterium]